MIKSKEMFRLSKQKNLGNKSVSLLLFSMTTLVSGKVQLFTGWRDIPKDKSQTFHFLKKTYLQFLRQGQKLAVILENNVVQNLKLGAIFILRKGVFGLFHTTHLPL